MALTVESPAFADGDSIPRRFGYHAENVNPPLTITDAPEATRSLAIVVDDPDAEPVAGHVWDHWIVWNVPSDVTDIPAGWDPQDAGASVGRNDYGEHAYGGPNPPDGPHEYRFEVYALDTELSLSPETDVAGLRSTMKGHVLATDRLTGTYAPS